MAKFSLVHQDVYRKSLKSSSFKRMYWLLLEKDDEIYRWTSKDNPLASGGVTARMDLIDDPLCKDFLNLEGYSPPGVHGNFLNKTKASPIFYTVIDKGLATVLSESPLKVSFEGKLLNGIVNFKKRAGEWSLDITNSCPEPLPFLDNFFNFNPSDLSKDNCYWVLHKTTWNALSVVRYDLRVYDGTIPVKSWGMRYNPFLTDCYLTSIKSDIANTSALVAKGSIPPKTEGWNLSEVAADISTVSEGYCKFLTNGKDFMLQFPRGSIELKLKELNKNRWLIKFSK